MQSRRLLPIITLVLLAIGDPTAVPASEGQTVEFTIDARRLGDQILTSELSIPTPAEWLDEQRNLVLDYPLYIPGTHTSSGPVQNVAGIEIEDCRGRTLGWDRNPHQLERLTVQVPPDCSKIQVETTYLASQPSVNSKGIDSYGWQDLGAISFNTVFWAPAGRSHQELHFAGRVLFPGHWSHVVSSLPHTTAPQEGTVTSTFERASLAEFVDAPVVAGKHAVTLELDLPGHPPHTFTALSKELDNATPPDWLQASLEEVVRQSTLLMGPFPRRRFDFLFVLAPGIDAGLEHGESTLIGDPEDTLVDAKPNDEIQAGGATISVIPHEYVHAWCGKLRAPIGLVPPTFNEPINSELLWVYEGLTSYLDDLVSVRAGWITFEEYRNNLVRSLLAFEQKEGRRWRSVEDTARDSGRLRGGSPRWGDLRRRQDYYSEGAAFWLEADARIRRGTAGAKSLDDFVHRFFDVPVRPVGALEPYDRQTLVDTLAEVWDGEDWSDLIRRRIEDPVESLSMDYLVELLGYQWNWTSEPSALQKALAAKNPARVDLRTSLGLRVDDGAVASLVPGGLADLAGIPHDAELVGVNGWRYSPERLRDAVRDSAEQGGVHLLLDIEGRLEGAELPYSLGARYPQLEPLDAADDLLREIAAPRTEPVGPTTAR